MKPTPTLIFVTAILSLAISASCDVDCRSIEVSPLDIGCDLTSDFTGELHFDRAATFRTFLTDDCLLAGDAELDALVESVDFSLDAVVVARGTNNLNGDCLTSRSVEAVQTCSSGLRIAFADEVNNEEICTRPRWVVAFSVDRAELRAALEAGAL